MKDSGHFYTPAALITGKSPQLTHGTERRKSRSIALDVWTKEKSVVRIESNKDGSNF
jgi:hypothetical protein